MEKLIDNALFLILLFLAVGRPVHGQELDFSAEDEDLISKTIINSQNTNVQEIVEQLEDRNLNKMMLLNIKNSEALLDRTKLPGIKQWIKEQIATEYSMNIGVAFQLLEKVGQLLRVAYAGCKKFTCSVPVSEVYSDYQDMIFDSKRVSGKFVRAVKSAMRYHRYAIRYLDDDEYKKAFKWMSKCATLADRLVKEANKMVDLSEKLKEMTATALFEAVGNDKQNTDRLRQTNDTINSMRARMKTINKNLELQLAQEREHKKTLAKLDEKISAYEQRYAKTADREIKTVTLCKASVVSRGGVPGLFNLGEKVVKVCHTELDKADVTKQGQDLAEINKLIDGVRETKIKAMQIKYETQQNVTALYAALAGGMETLKSKHHMKNELFEARRSLEIAHQTLAIVKTIFLHSLNFWLSLSDSAQSKGTEGDLQDILEITGFEDSEELSEEFMESAFSWLAMGKVAVEADNMMLIVRGKVTKGFINLPTHEQAKAVINAANPIISETQQLLAEISKSKETTQAEIEEAIKLTKEDGEPSSEIEDQDLVDTELELK